MKGYLAELYAEHVAMRELKSSRDTPFLDLLVAMENERDPRLNLSVHSIDYAGLLAGRSAALGDLAGRAVAGMETGRSWRAIVSMDGHEVAASVRHDPQRPMHLSIIVVDSTGKHFRSRDWRLLASSLGTHLNDALANTDRPREDTPRHAQVAIHCLNTGTQRTNEGGAIFAIAAAREMPDEPDIASLHEHVLARAASQQEPITPLVIYDNSLLGPRFFKHMTLKSNMQDLLATRPELAEQPVNKKGETLLGRQRDRLLEHRPQYGLQYKYSDSYETKRIRMYERVIARLETAAAPQLHAARIDGMSAHLDDLLKAHETGTAAPAPRDAEFVDLLVDGLNTIDPQLRLSAQKIDVRRLAAGDRAAIDGLWGPLADGVRSGGAWHAALDLNGHYAALSARHDPKNFAHVSLAILDGAGSFLSTGNVQSLSILLGQRLLQMLTDTDPARSGKVWLTHLDVSARQPAAHSATFALRAIREMNDDPGIASVHREALAEARSRPDPIDARFRDGVALLDPDYHPTPDAGNTMADADMLIDDIEMYRAAVDHHKRSPDSKRPAY